MNRKKENGICSGGQILFFSLCDNIGDMPELPEVETIKGDLEKKVVGKTISDFGSEWKKRVRPSFVKFKKGVMGRKIIGSRRIGKHVILDLNDENSIVMHMKMTGHLLLKSKKFRSLAPEFERHWFVFEDGGRLEFSDMRKFGWVFLVKTEEVGNMKEIKSLGIDALDKKLSFEKFNELLEKKKKSKIGIILLKQNWIAGVGNIYRSEILFRARVHPERIVGELKLEERKRVFVAMRTVLKEAVEMRGTSDVDYRDTEGKKGTFQNFLKVYRREGEKCVKCKGKVERMKLGQRSVFFCEGCQG